MSDDPDDIQEALEKIVDLAIERGHLKPTERKGALGQAMIHHGDKRTYLRKLIERRGGLTTDEAMRLEQEALAPPPPPPPSKPLPKLGDRKTPARKKPSRRLISPSPLPSLSAPREPDAAPKRDEIQVYKRGLPNLGAKKPAEDEDAPDDDAS